jgi:hypothetical protein
MADDDQQRRVVRAIAIKPSDASEDKYTESESDANRVCHGHSRSHVWERPNKDTPTNPRTFSTDFMFRMNTKPSDG